MHQRVLTLALGIGISAIAAPASAADFGGLPQRPAFAPQFSWAGPYVGLHFSLTSGTSHDSEEPDFPIRSQYVGAHAGYNALVTGNLVLGIEADISAGGPGGFIQYIDADPMLGPVTLTEQINWMASLRGRAGFAMGDWMPFVSLGLSHADATRTTGFMQTITRGHSGWTFGAGVEWMFAPNWVARGEYRYYSFGPRTLDWAIGGPSAVDFNFSTLEFGLNYKF
jgi:opacity protein-like surface antigen